MDTKHEFHFCPVCGGKLKDSKMKSHRSGRPHCESCAYVFYPGPKLVACSIVEVEGRIVLLKRGIPPQKGKWVVPGGYVDQGEKVEAAALREAKEECGLDIDIKKLLGVYSYPGKVEVMIFYVAGCSSGRPIPGDETLEVRLCRPDDIPWQ